MSTARKQQAGRRQARRQAKRPAKRAARRPVKRSNLREYEARRDFEVTPEPAPGPGPVQSDRPRFVVHKHDATRLHYDVRLEMDGALASWSVPKGPSYDPGAKRLAVQTEDHPLEYGSFEGRIPDGEYGAGDSLIWDEGACDSVPPGKLSGQRKAGRITVRFEGHKLNGVWHLVRTRGGPGGKPQWLMFKAKDETAKPSFDVVAERPESVVSGRVQTRGPERKKQLESPRAPPEKLLEPLLPPMLATLVDAAPPGDFQVELKYDGYRALCAVSSGRVAMLSRNGLDLSGRFPAVARALGRLVVSEAVLDGEIVALDPEGVPRFERLQQGHDDEAVLFAFDLLRLDGEDLRRRPLRERRDLLLSVLSNAPPALRVSEELKLPPTEALEKVRQLGLEGVLLKERESTWDKGRSRSWLKLKAQAQQELAVVGWMPGKGAAAGGVGALLLGVSEGGRYRFAGKVGTGFSAKVRKSLLAQLKADETSARPDGAPRLRDAHWVTPKLAAQVRFTEWTADGKLRHPAFLGLREDKKAEECVREQPAKADAARRPASSKPAGAPEPRGRNAPIDVQLTNPARVLYPGDGVTKAQVAAYYEAVQEPLLRALRDRPLSLVHWSQGIARPAWFQQDVSRDREPWMTVIETETRIRRGSVAHLVADRPEALRWLAQRSVLEVHMWHSRKDSLTQPDWVVFDLDPAEGKGIETAVEVAQILHGLFEQLGLPSAVKTTGKRGLHVLVPLAKGHTYDDALSFALRVGEVVAAQLPDRVTLERALSRRDGRLYLDCLQNAYGKTIVAPYSPRGAKGAPVSAPLRWAEVKPGLDPAAFDLTTMPGRLAREGDLFEAALRGGVRLPRSLR